MSLHHLEFGSATEGRPALIIIHGLFGSSVNWRSIAKKFSDHYHTFAIDQRNHGQSPHCKSMSYVDMATDLYQFIIELDLRKVYLCGHSMGGKTAMLFAQLYPEMVEKLVVLDIAPITYTHTYNPFLDTLMSIDLTKVNSRGAAEKLARDGIPDMATRLFLMQSLTRDRNRDFVWQLNLPVLKQFMSEITSFPIDVVKDKKYLNKSLFLYGENSDYVQRQHYEIIKQYFPDSEIEGIANAGHWLHVDQGEAVLNSVLNFLKK